MSKKKLSCIVYLIFFIVCVVVIAYNIWKEKLDIEYKTKIINSPQYNVEELPNG